MGDAVTVDVGIIGGALLGEILAEIGAVGADGFGQLAQRQAVLQIELRFLTAPLEQRTEIGGNGPMDIVGLGLNGSIIILDFQFLKRLHTPEEECDDDKRNQLRQILPRQLSCV